MPNRQRYTVKQIIDALNACNGLVYLAAAQLGCTSATICNYENRYPKIRALVNEKRGRRVDVAEASLDQAVLKGEAWAVQFLLRTQARDRGYGDSMEHTGPNGAPLPVPILRIERHERPALNGHVDA